MSRPEYHVWSYAEEALLFELRDDEGMEWDEISERMGIATNKCESKYWSVTYRKRTSINAIKHVPNVPNAAIINREKRQLAHHHQSLTGLIFGDPEPGFSALDRRVRT